MAEESARTRKPLANKVMAEGAALLYREGDDEPHLGILGRASSSYVRRLP